MNYIMYKEVFLLVLQIANRPIVMQLVFLYFI